MFQRVPRAEGGPFYAFLLALLGLATACGGDVTAVALHDPEDYAIHSFAASGDPKVDLLLVVDNSLTMGDKRQLFSEAMVGFARRLITPMCFDDEGNPTGEFSPCSTGRREFPPVRDLHVGVISSSLGSHGGDVCAPNPDAPERTLNDRAELMPSVRDGLYSFQDAGVLVWDTREPRAIPDPHVDRSAHETVPEEFLADVASHIEAAGDKGCGYEAPLEAWYRFLIDPEPVSDVTNDGVSSVRGPVNRVVLEQRARFLRPDSLLVIVMLTDENDCSIIDEDGAAGWLVGQRQPMSRASSECASPGDDAMACCRPCTVEIEGCPSNETDPECRKGTHLEPGDDSTNLRCYRQLERFGVDLRYPVQRYVQGLKRPRIALRSPRPGGPVEVENPIFAKASGTNERARRVFLAGITGVPWQDLADEASLRGPELDYLSTSALEHYQVNSGVSRWDVILGEPGASVPPLDPFMIESIEERSGVNPITRDAIAPSSSEEPMNAINGHEQSAWIRDDLQYACTYELSAAVPCTPDNQDRCECNATEESYRRSICEYEATGTDGTQTHGKAYPGLRQLEVLKELGNQAIVASACPKNVVAERKDPALDPAYGYNPAVAAMLREVARDFEVSCLSKPLSVDVDGRVPCRVIEVTSADTCTCEASFGRAEPGRALSTEVSMELEARGWCGEGTSVSCEDYCLCEIQQFTGDDLTTCRTSPNNAGGLHGFCYVDDATSPELVLDCPSRPKQNLRFMGGSPPSGDTVFLACRGF